MPTPAARTARRSQFSWRGGFLIALIAAVGLAMIVVGPIAQPGSYHGFADQRTLWAIPNFWNVISNAPFIVIGVQGLWLLTREPWRRALSPAWIAYAVFFVALGLVGVGSTYYHLAPSNQTLVWDRLPIALGFAAFFVAILGEHVNPKWIRLALAPALLAAASSVAWWRISGDLRPYALVQLLPLVAIPAILLLYPVPRAGRKWIWAALAAYLVAKAFESLDGPIYLALGISGHTLKHLAAAVGLYGIVIGLRARRPPAAASTRV